MFVRPRDRAKEVWNGTARARGRRRPLRHRRGASARGARRRAAEVPRRRHPPPLRARPEPGVRPPRPCVDRALAQPARPAGTASPRSSTSAASSTSSAPQEDARPRLESLRRAAALSARGAPRRDARVRPGIDEYEIQAVIEYVCRSRGSARLGYPCDRRGGRPRDDPPLHRERRRASGTATSCSSTRAARSTTTPPTSRGPGPRPGGSRAPQRALYEIVLEAQLAAIDACRPGRTMQEVHDVATRVLVDGMLRVGLLQRERPRR